MSSPKLVIFACPYSLVKKGNEGWLRSTCSGSDFGGDFFGVEGSDCDFSVVRRHDSSNSTSIMRLLLKIELLIFLLLITLEWFVSVSRC